MKGKMLVMLAVFLMAVSLVSADNGFNFHKTVDVKGDWEWQGDHWDKTYPSTANFDMVVESVDATDSDVNNWDNIGTAWQYEGETMVSVNSATDYNNELRACTVNDPDTTPATGGHTQYEYHEMTVSDNPDSATTVTLSVEGEGDVDVNSNTETTKAATQFTHVKIN